MNQISIMKNVLSCSYFIAISGYCGDVGSNAAAAAQQDIYQKREEASRSGYIFIHNDEEFRNVYRENPDIKYIYICEDAKLYMPRFCPYKKLERVIVERRDAQTRASCIGDWTSGDCSIPGQIFRDCTNLKEIELPDNLAFIGMYAFCECTSLALAKLPPNVTIIDYCAFYNCKSLALTSLPLNLIFIGNEAFGGCTSLILTSLPTSVRMIGYSAFEGCTSLALTELPPNLEYIDSYAFKCCTSLKIKTLPVSTISIGEGAFEGCYRIETMTIPGSVRDIYYGAFRTTGLRVLDLSKCSCASFYDVKHAKVPLNAENILNCLFGTSECRNGDGARSVRECICNNCVVRLPHNLGGWIFSHTEGKWRQLPRRIVP